MPNRFAYQSFTDDPARGYRLYITTVRVNLPPGPQRAPAVTWAPVYSDRRYRMPSVGGGAIRRGGHTRPMTQNKVLRRCLPRRVAAPSTSFPSPPRGWAAARASGIGCIARLVAAPSYRPCGGLGRECRHSVSRALGPAGAPLPTILGTASAPALAGAPAEAVPRCRSSARSVSGLPAARQLRSLPCGSLLC